MSVSCTSFYAASRAMFAKRFSLFPATPSDRGFDNGTSLNWRNKANSADVSAFRVSALNQLQALSTLNLSSIVPGTETWGSLISNDLRWSIASGNLVSVVVASNVGTLTFSEAHNKAVGDTIVLAGATVDTDLNATYTVASVPSATTLTVTTSNVANATYTDALIVVTAWQTFATAGAAALKFLCANISATGNFASMRVRARSDIATPTWNQNTMAMDLAASANIANYGELLTLSVYTQDNGFNQARGDHWNTGGKFCMLCTGTSAGSRYALVVTDYSTTKAATAHYLARFDKPTGACAIDGVFTFGAPDQFTYLARFEGTTGMVTVTGTAPANFGARIAILVGATPMWLTAYTTSNA